MTMIKAIFTDELKKDVDQYVLNHLDESKVKSSIMLTAQSINGIKMPIIMMLYKYGSLELKDNIRQS